MASFCFCLTKRTKGNNPIHTIKKFILMSHFCPGQHDSTSKLTLYRSVERAHPKVLLKAPFLGAGLRTNLASESPLKGAPQRGSSSAVCLRAAENSLQHAFSSLHSPVFSSFGRFLRVCAGGRELLSHDLSFLTFYSNIFPLLFTHALIRPSSQRFLELIPLMAEHPFLAITHQVASALVTSLNVSDAASHLGTLRTHMRATDMATAGEGRRGL